MSFLFITQRHWAQGQDGPVSHGGAQLHARCG